MEKSANFNFSLPSRDNDTDIADINQISDNFRVIDDKIMPKETVIAELNKKADKTEIPIITIDTEISDTSENAVQNKAVKAYIDGKKISRIVNCSAFTNQPTITETELNTAFVPWNVNYYYVHIIDSTAGTFKLMTVYNDATSCIDQTFTISGLDTGNSGILKENSLVDFLTVGENWQMRNAGVYRLRFTNLNSKYVRVNVNGFSDLSGYHHIESIAGMNNDCYCASSSLSTVYNGAPGFLFSNKQHRKNLLISYCLDISVFTHYIDFDGQYYYKKLKENDRTTYATPVVSKVESINGVFYKKDMGALPIEKISWFDLAADGLFLNGTEIVITGKERDGSPGNVPQPKTDGSAKASVQSIEDVMPVTVTVVKEVK